MYTLEDATRDGWTGDEARRFTRWKQEVDRHLIHLCGLSSDDLPDAEYAANFASGTPALDMAREVLENECSELGFEVWF